jgi:hypothetical protein
MASSISNKQLWNGSDYNIWLREFSNTNTKFPKLKKILIVYSDSCSIVGL